MGLSVDLGETSAPASLAVITSSSGVVTGLSPVCRVRRSESAEYLDFSDDTFKASGWTTKTTAMTEAETGVYLVTGGIDISAITNLSSTTSLIFEYQFVHLTNTFVSTDLVSLEGHKSDLAANLTAINNNGTAIAGVATNVTLVKKVNVNRAEIDFTVSPRTLKIYDDDDTTVLLTHNLETNVGEDVTTQAGVQTKRSKGV